MIIYCSVENGRIVLKIVEDHFCNLVVNTVEEKDNGLWKYHVGLGQDNFDRKKYLVTVTEGPGTYIMSINQ